MAQSRNGRLLSDRNLYLNKVRSTCTGIKPAEYGISVTKQYFTRLAQAIFADLFRRLQRHRVQIGFVKEILKVRSWAEGSVTQPRSCRTLCVSQETLPSSSVIYLALASARCVFIASVECFDRSLWTKLKAARGQPRVSLFLIARLARVIRKGQEGRGHVQRPVSFARRLRRSWDDGRTSGSFVSKIFMWHLDPYGEPLRYLTPFSTSR